MLKAGDLAHLETELDDHFAQEVLRTAAHLQPNQEDSADKDVDSEDVPKTFGEELLRCIEQLPPAQVMITLFAPPSNLFYAAGSNLF